MSRERRNARVAGLLLIVVALCPRAQAIDLYGDSQVLGQVREGTLSKETEVPVELFGAAGASDLPFRSSADTFFRLQNDFANDRQETDFYAGYADVPGALPGTDVTGGRMFLSESPGGVFVADGGRARVDAGPVALSAYGGVPQYWEPTYGAPYQSQDETIFGGNVRTNGWRNGYLDIGYFQQNRDQRTLRQLITGTGSRSFPDLIGMPNVYATVAYDADGNNLSQATAGFDAFFLHPQLTFNFQSTYYKPQSQGEYVIPDINLRKDGIFELFSVSDLLQFRGGLNYVVTRNLSAYANYSFQRYEQTDNNYVNGNLGSVGATWLPGGDGLEVVRWEYYVIDGTGGTVNGVRGYYENRVYDRIVFRANVDVAHYDKATNQSYTPVASTLGLGYLFTPSLFAEVAFEANHNALLAEDFRFDFQLTYKFQHHSERPADSRQTPGGQPS